MEPSKGLHFEFNRMYYLEDLIIRNVRSRPYIVIRTIYA